VNGIFPPYAGQVSFVAADIDPLETPAMVRDYQKTTGFNWTYAMADVATVQRFNVLRTDTKFAVDRRGVITYQAGYGGEDAKTWQAIFERLVQA
jgi:hypothetical protein